MMDRLGIAVAALEDIMDAINRAKQKDLHLDLLAQRIERRVNIALRTLEKV